MSATRNPYYQLPGGTELPGDVRVSDTADPTKTAAGGWAASPAAVQSVGKLANAHIHYFDVHDDNSASFTFHFRVNRNASGDSFRAVFWVFCTHQSGNVSGAAIIFTAPSTINEISNFISYNGLLVSSVMATKDSTDDTLYSVKVVYNIENIWSPAFVICQSGWITDVF